MAKPRDLSEEGDEEVLEKDIGELRSAKKELFQYLRPYNDMLERIARRERECVDIQHRLIAEKHDRQKQKQTVERLIEVGTKACEERKRQTFRYDQQTESLFEPSNKVFQNTEAEDC